MDLILSACPSYEKRWPQYVNESYDEGEERLLYLDLADFAHHLVVLYQAQKLKEFPMIFEASWRQLR